MATAAELQAMSDGELQSHIADLNARFGPLPQPPPPPPPSTSAGALFGRAVGQQLNLGPNIAQGLLGSLYGVGNFMARGLDEPPPPVAPPQVWKPVDLPPAQNLPEQTIDFGAGLASQIGQAMVPGAGLTKVAGVLGAGARLAPILGDIGTGAFMGAQYSPQESAMQAGEFGAMGATRFLPWYVRGPLNAAIPMAGQAVRGQSVTDPQSLLQTGTQTLLSLIHGRAAWNEEAPPPAQTAPQFHGPYDPYSVTGDNFTMGAGTSPQHYQPNAPETRAIVPFQSQSPVPAGSGHGFTFAPSDTQWIEPQPIGPQPRTQPLQLQDGRPLLNSPQAIINEPNWSADTRFTTPGYEPPEAPAARPLLRLTDAPPEPPVVKLARSPNISTADLATELRLYSDEERADLARSTDSADTTPRGLAETLKGKYGAPEPAPLSEYGPDEVSPGRADEVDAALAAREDAQGARGMTPRRENGGFLNLAHPATQSLIGSAIGGIAGGTQGDTTEERMRNALIGAAGGAATPFLLRGGIRLGQSLDRAQGLRSAESGAIGKSGKRLLASDETPADAIRPAYDALVAKDRFGFQAVSIGKLAKESGVPLDVVRAQVIGLHNAGKAVLSKGDWSLSDADTRDGAVHVGGERYLQVRMLPESGMAQSSSEAGGLNVGKFFGQVNDRLDRAAVEEERNQPSALGRTARDLELLTKRNQAAATDLALQKGIGEKNLRSSEATGAATVLASSIRNDPALKAPIDAYYGSQRTAADETLLRRSVPAPLADAVLKFEEQKTLMGETNAAANEGSPQRQAPFQNARTWQGRFYQADVNPKEWPEGLPGSPERTALIKEMTQDPEWKGFNYEQIGAALDEYGARRRGEISGAMTPGGATQKLDRTLLIRRKDLTVPEWNFLNRLSGDSRLSAHEKYGVNDIVNLERLNGNDKALLQTMANDPGRFSEPERIVMGDIAKSDVISKAHRAYLGEITDPTHREILSVDKLMHSAASAKAIASLRHEEVDGRKLILTPGEHAAAVMAADARGDAATGQSLRDYKLAGDAPGLGSIAGQFVDRQVLDALNAENRVSSPWQGWMSRMNNVMKTVLTVPNPGTHARWWMQIPTMALMGRVAPWEIGGGLRMMRDAAGHSELMAQNIVGANFSHAELRHHTQNLEQLFAPPTTGQRLLSGPGKLWEKLQSAYGLPDDIIRSAIYAKQKRLNLAQGMPEQAARDAATSFTNRYALNYSNPSPLLAKLRNIPFVSPFMSYNAGMLRILKNMGEDLVSGSAHDRAWAIANIGQLLALPLTATAAAVAAMSEKDREDWNKMKNVETPDQRDMLKVPLGREKDGSFRYFNLGSILPAGDYAAMLRDFARGDFKALALSNPFVGIDRTPALNTVASIAAQQDVENKRPVKTLPQIAMKVAQSFTPPLTPYVGYGAQKAARAFTPNTEGGFGVTDIRTGRRDTPADFGRSLIGLGTSSEQPNALLRSFVTDMQEEMKQNHSQLLRTAATNASPLEKQRALEIFKRKQQDILEEKLPLLRAAQSP